MKRLVSLLCALTVLAGLVLPLTAVHAAETNLLANPSVETAAGANPANWASNRWGNNTATLTYKSEGHTGAKSLEINMTARTDGDAKWMADAVSVEANKSYTYTAWYKATTDTEIDLQYTDASGNVSYAYVQAVPAATEWTQLTATFKTPANAAKVTVLHLIAGVGTLQTDDHSLVLADTSTPPVTPPVDPSGNLITNASFETANGANPANWEKNAWGANTPAFTYENTGRTGTKSAKVTLNAYTNGDAKWYATPVAITGGETYTYTDWYTSAVASRVVVAFIDASGNYTYHEVAGATASATWKQYSATFAAPANAVKVSVYHLIDRVGSLTIDDVSLAKATTTPNPNPNPVAGVIPNGSFETASAGNASLPDQWTSSKWGSNTAQFQYVNGGRTGTKSAKVTVSNYVDGDAKWYFNPLNVDGTTLKKGKQYRFTTWYKTNVIPKAVAMFIKADGTEQYFGMPNPQPTASAATTWTKYSDTFSIPQDAVSVSVFMFVNQNGWLQTDDYSISDYTPVGFNQPLLTLTFDDGHEDNVTNALPLMNQYGIKSTQCFMTQAIKDDPVVGVQNVKAFSGSGHEICSHTVTHPMLTSLTSANLTKELKDSQTYLQSIIGKPVTNFASPYGDYNASVNTQIKKYYTSHRTVDEGYNSKDNFDIYRIRVQNILSTTSAAQVQAWIDQAKADKTWLVLVYHRVGANPEEFDTDPAMFRQHIDVIRNAGITIKTYQQALDELKPQL